MTAVTKRIAVVVVMLFAAYAFAQGAKEAADAAFKRGRELLKVGKFADACVEFEHSQKLDPALGTEFNIAQCSEKSGKLARALEMYRDLVARDTKADRKAEAAAAVPKLEARVPHLEVKVSSPPTGFSLTIQIINAGLPPRALEVNKPIEIDFGEYELVAKAPGATDWRQNLRIDTEAKTTTIEPPFGTKPATPPINTTKTNPNPTKTNPTTTATTNPIETEPETDDPTPPKSKRKLYGIIAMGVGGAAIVTGVIFGSMASSKWDEAKKVCGGTTCTNQMDLDKANSLKDSASSKATLSTVFVGVGVAAAAAGVVLFLTAPKPESSTQVSAHPTSDGAAITISGHF